MISDQIPHLPSWISDPHGLPSTRIQFSWYSKKIPLPLVLVAFHSLSTSPCSLAINPQLSLLCSELSPIFLFDNNTLLEIILNRSFLVVQQVKDPTLSLQWLQAKKKKRERPLNRCYHFNNSHSNFFLEQQVPLLLPCNKQGTEAQ